MSQLTRRTFMVTAAALPLIALTGCKEPEDPRTTDEKIHAPAPDLKTRKYMACPKCGAPHRPYMVNELKSFYRCSGLPPKFRYHEEYLYQHTIERRDCKRTEI